MSDLVKRLRDGTSDFDDWEEAADRIEQLERELAEANTARENSKAKAQRFESLLAAEKALADRRECPSFEVRP